MIILTKKELCKELNMFESQFCNKIVKNSGTELEQAMNRLVWLHLSTKIQKIATRSIIVKLDSLRDLDLLKKELKQLRETSQKAKIKKMSDARRAMTEEERHELNQKLCESTLVRLIKSGTALRQKSLDKLANNQALRERVTSRVNSN